MLLNNVIGVSFMAVYVCIFACFAQRERRARIYGQIAVALVLVGVAIAIAWLVDSPDEIFGTAAIVLNSIKYASPLSIARLVIRTQSVEFMPLPLTLASFACGICWGLHGILLQDAFIWVPNFIGVAFSLIQIALYIRYCGGGHKMPDEVTRSSDDGNNDGNKDRSADAAADGNADGNADRTEMVVLH